VTRGRPVRGLVGGFLLGLCVDLDLAFSGAVKLNSVVLTIVPLALLVLGLLLGLWAPVGRSRGGSLPNAATAAAVPGTPPPPGGAAPPPSI
jgi:hypothetical protein